MIKYFTSLTLFLLLGHMAFAQCDDFEINPQALPVSCAGDCDGSIWGNDVSGGTQPYMYEWSDGTTTWTFGDVNNLCPGTYCLTVTDANGCSLSDCVDIIEPDPLDVIVNAQSLSCGSSSCNGSGQANPFGGTPPYSYSWSNGDNSGNASGLCEGDYCVTITDDSGCETSECITIGGAMTIATSSTAATCNDGSDGTVTVTAMGGTAPMTYMWDTGDNTATVTGLPQGYYCVTVMDATSCSLTECIYVSAPMGIAIEATSTNLDCFGDTNGNATVTGSGGVMPYSYLWNNGATSQDINNLGAGEYCVTITDANGCTAEDCTTVNEPELFEIAVVNINNATCLDDTDGSINITGSGGTLPYSCTWSTGGTGDNLNNVGPGTYTVTCIDANGCSATMDIDVGTEGISGLSTSVITQISANGGNDGQASATGSGGVLPLSYMWSNGANTQIASGLSAGTYTVTITDNLGCQATGSVDLEDPGSIGDFVWQDDNANGIQDMNELPLEGVYVVLNGEDNFGNQIFKDYTTGSDGTYMFDGVPAGEYRLAFEAPANYIYSPQNAGNDPALDSDIDEDGVTETITVTGGSNIIDVDAGFSLCARIGDYVWNDENRNGIQEGIESGIANVKVQLYAVGIDHVFGTSDDVLRGETYTDQYGRYDFDCISLNNYGIKFSYAGIEDGDFLWSPQFAANEDNDSDVNENGLTEKFAVTSDNLNDLSFDAGMFNKCYNYATGGEIDGVQAICAGDPVAKIENLNTPTGAVEAMDFAWMMSTDSNDPTTGNWTVIPGANENSFLPSSIEETTYFVRLVKSEGCGSFTITSNVIEVLVNEPGQYCATLSNEIEMTAYPNPAIEMMTVAFKSPLKEGAVLEIFSTDGQISETQKLAEGSTFTEVDLTLYPSGMYIVKIKYVNAEEITTLKAFKQ